MKSLFFFFLFFSTIIGFSCLNESGTNLAGEITSLDPIDFFSSITDYPDQTEIDERLNNLRKNLAVSQAETKNDFYTDIAVYMIYNGDFQEAIDYMNTNVINKYDNYSFCSNIGVAHELVGNLDSALYWTKRGLEINEESHTKSEWIHVRILEVEIELKKDENWLTKNNIFDFELSQDSMPTIFPANFDYFAFSNQLYFQLYERTYFVKPKNQDPVVAQLLLIHADVSARAFDTKKCIPTYNLAAQYDSTLIPLVNKRLAYLANFELENGLEEYEYTNRDGLNLVHDNKKDELLNENNGTDDSIDKPKKKKKVIKYIEFYLIGGFLIVLVLLFFFLRKKRK